MRVSFGPISDVGAFLNEVSPTPTNGHHAEGRPGPKSAPDSKVAALFNGADEPGPDDRIHDGSGGHQPGTARAGSLEPRQIASHSGPDTKSSPSTAARLRLFGCRTSPARTTGIAVENTRRMQITVQRMRAWLLYGNGAASDGLKLQLLHVVQRRARSGASYDHSPSSKSSRRIELCEA